MELCLSLSHGPPTPLGLLCPWGEDIPSREGIWGGNWGSGAASACPELMSPL